jgi:hypothetical protein
MIETILLAAAAGAIGYFFGGFIWREITQWWDDLGEDD